jgi:hypothetical protein
MANNCGPNTDVNCLVSDTICLNNRLACGICKDYFVLKDGKCMAVTYPDYIKKKTLKYPSWIEQNRNRTKIKISLILLLGLILIAVILAFSDLIFLYIKPK